MKIITEIEVPDKWRITNDWDSHRPLLWLTVSKQGGDIMEMGSGIGSTPILDSYCVNNLRKFVSVENNNEYRVSCIGAYQIFDDYFNVEESWKDEVFKYVSINILFIDCAPAEIRKELLKKWENKSDVIIVHDTEDGAEYVYGMKDVLSKFKYHLKFEPKGLPATSLVSNSINVEEWI